MSRTLECCGAPMDERFGARQYHADRCGEAKPFLPAFLSRHRRLAGLLRDVSRTLMAIADTLDEMAVASEGEK